MPASTNSNTVRRGYDRVFAIYDYQDGPRTGIGNFHDTPHFFDCVFDEKRDQYSDAFVLTALEPRVFEAGMENWRIFLRWRAAYDVGKVNRDTHPALPEDRAKYEETTRILDQAVAAGQENSIRVSGEFDAIGDSIPRDVLTVWQVRWTNVDA